MLHITINSYSSLDCDSKLSFSRVKCSLKLYILVRPRVAGYFRPCTNDVLVILLIKKKIKSVKKESPFFVVTDAVKRWKYIYVYICIYKTLKHFSLVERGIVHCLLAQL